MPPRRSKRRRDNDAAHDDAASAVAGPAAAGDDADDDVAEANAAPSRDGDGNDDDGSPSDSAFFAVVAAAAKKAEEEKKKKKKKKKKEENSSAAAAVLGSKRRPGGKKKLSKVASSVVGADAVPDVLHRGMGGGADDDDNDDGDDDGDDDDDDEDDDSHADLLILCRPPGRAMKSSLLSDLLLRVQVLSKSRSRCASALRAMVEGRVAYAAHPDERCDNDDDDDDDDDSGDGDDDDDGGSGGGGGAALAPSFAPDLAAYAASLSGEDAASAAGAAAPPSLSHGGRGGGGRGKSGASSSSAAAGRGRRRKKGGADAGGRGGGRSRQQRGAGGRRGDAQDNDDDFGGAAEEDGDGTPSPRDGRPSANGSDDAHLIMATTHAINVLLAHLRKRERERKCEGGDNIGGEGTTTTTTTTGDDGIAAIALISLSSPLLKCLVNDRALLENITKAKSSRPAGGAAATAAVAVAAAAAATADAEEGGASGGGGGGGGGGWGTFHFPADTDDELHGGVAPGSTMTTGVGGGGGQRGGPSLDCKSGIGAAASGVSAAETRRIMMSHAKAAVGRAMTSGVMGALYGLETLGKSMPTKAAGFHVGDDNGGGVSGNDSGKFKDMKTDADEIAGSERGGRGDDADNDRPRPDDAFVSVERAIQRKCLWSGLMTLETAFQLTPKPRLLATSSASSSVSSPGYGTLRNASSGGGGAPITSSGIPYGGGMPMTASTATAATASILNFDYFSASVMGSVSATTTANATANAVGGTGGSGDVCSALSSSMSSVGHAHLKMGADTILMWNSLLSRLLSDYEVGFQRTQSTSRVWRVEEGFEEEKQYAHDEEEATENERLAQICNDVTELVFADEEDSKLISLLLEEYVGKKEETFSGSEPPKKTRKTASTSTASRVRNKGSGSSSKQAQKETTSLTTTSLSHIVGADYSKLSALLSSRIENHISFDCHVSIRRWAVLAFGWLCSGQKRLLEMGAEMLRNPEVWGKVLQQAENAKKTGLALNTNQSVEVSGSKLGVELTDTASVSHDSVAAAPSSSSAVAAAVLPVKRRKTKRDNVKSNTSSTSQRSSFDVSTADSSNRGVPGNLALIVFISAMIDTIYDAGATGGSPPSSGWMDEYVKAVIGGSGVVVDEEEDNESKPASTSIKSSQISSAATAETAMAAEAPSGVRRSSRKRSQTNKGINSDVTNKRTTAATAAMAAVGSPRNFSRVGGTSFLSSPRSSGGSLGGNKRGSTPLVWIRPDIRDLTAVMTKRLIESHWKSLSDIFNLTNVDLTSDGGVPKKGFVLVNDDDTFFGSTSPSSKRRTNASSSPTGSSRDKSGSISSVRYYYPFMHRTLETLGRSAASSAFLASSNDGKGKILAIGSAVALGCFSQSYKEMQEGHAVALDTKLLSMAVCELSECLGSVLLGATRAGAAMTSSASLPQEILTTYRLNEPLDINTKNAKLAAATQSAATSSSSSSDYTKGGGNVTSFSSYGGALSFIDDDKTNTAFAASVTETRSLRGGLEKPNPAEILSLFIRAQIVAEGSGKPLTAATVDDGGVVITTCNSAIASLIQSLLGIIRICYDFDLETHSHGGCCVEGGEPSSNKKEPMTSKKKKRKADECMSSVLEMLGPEIHPRKTFSRCALAVGSLKALIQSFVNSMAPTFSSNDNAESAAHILRSHLRWCLSEDMVLTFIKLGYLLEEKLIRPRLGLAKSEFDTAARVLGPSGPSVSSDLFEPWEHQLWVCHIQLSLTIGGGEGNIVPCLDNRGSRLQVFRAVVAAENQLSQRVRASDNTTVIKPIDPSDDLWPLNLTAVHHALISPMVIYPSGDDSFVDDDDEPIAQLPQHAVELQFLCHSFLNSIEKYFGDLSNLPKTSGVVVISTEDVLISLRDARLFTLAISKLTRAGQRFLLARLIGIIHKGLQSYQDFDSGDTSGVIARGLSLFASVADMLSSFDLGPLLSKEVEATTYPMPRLKKQPHHPAIDENNQPPVIFHKEHFQSIFTAWQSPIPPIPNDSARDVFEERSDYEMMASAILTALTFGFETATNDGCHLLFSSWNAAAKLPSWTSQSSWDGPIGPAYATETLSAVERIMRLRVDMWELYKLMNAHQTSFQDYHDEAVRMRAGQIKTTSHRRNETLLRGLSGAENMLSVLTIEIGEKLSNPSTMTPSLATFAYYEALPLFVSFIISMHTRPAENDMGLAQRLQVQKMASSSSSRGSLPKNSTDRFAEESDLEIYDSTAGGGGVMRMNALTRLHEACLALGAAPCYPDWLDANCRLRNDIVPFVAVDSANRALSSLTKFGMEVWRSYYGAMQLMLRTLNQTENSTQEGDSVALKLLFAQQQHHANLSETFSSQIASLCGMNDSLISLLLFSMSSKQRLSGDALVTTSAHRILGAEFFKSWKVFMGERRANGQWETLLSEVLQASSSRIQSSTITHLAGDAVGSGNDKNDRVKQIVDALTSFHRWQRVLHSVVNAMVPAAALLRFGINDGKGIPLCEDNLPIPGSIFSSTSGRGESMKEKLKKSDKYGETKTTMKEALSFLSCVVAYSSHDEDIRLTSRAAAGHLLENSSNFNDLIALWSAVTCCDAIDDVMCMLGDDKKNSLCMSKSQKASAYSIIETFLTQFSDSPGEDTDDNCSLDIDKRTTLLACIGMKNLKTGKLIGCGSNLELTEMTNKCAKRNLPKLLLTLLFVPGLRIRSRIFVTEMLIDLMDAEREILKQGRKSGKNSVGGSNGDIVRAAVASSLDDLSTEEIRYLVNILTCHESLLLSKNAATVICYLASHSGITGNGCKIILEGILTSLSEWARAPSKHHLIRLLCLLASRYNALDKAGGKIVSLLKHAKKEGNDAAHEYVETAKDFFECVARLDRSVNKVSSTPDFSAAPTASLSRTTSLNHVTLKNGKVVPRTCSFVETGEGFTDQHWYNCYTCGLVSDKGCCSLCARICHKGHDIGYSRKSSFFCDCGAEVATAIEQKRTSCKCLTPLSEDVIIREFYQDESEVNHELESIQQAHYDSDVFIELMAKSFSSEFNDSLKNMVEEATKSDWRESILLILNQTYQTTSAASPSSTDFSVLLNSTSGTQTISGVGCPNLQSRSAQPLTVTRLYSSCLLPVRAAKASSLQSRLISGSSSTTSHTRKTRNDYHVQALAADNRGRLYIAESTTVIFCSSIPSVNVRYVDNSPASHLSRSQLSILGTDHVKFAISGMAMNSENNRHLLVWGVAKACVCIVSKTFDSFERIIDLKLNLEPSEECEYLVKCEWMPQSELQIVAVCGAVVHVFDLKRTENNTCNATTHYALAYEDVLIRSAALIGSLSVDDGAIIETKLALLLDTGRLYFISLTIDEEGNLEDHGESYIEIGAGVTFPSAGIRRYSGGDPAPKGATATTFGEGVYLAHLRLAKCLLYQCVSSPCIAMLLDEDGAICGSFELLPNMISTDDIGCNVAGPYTHFQELGIVMRDKESFFRVTCIGRSTRSSQPIALVLEFNEKSVSVRELAWPTSCSAGLGFISTYSFVGSCTFSCPYLLGSNEGLTNDESQVHERACLTLLSSSGSLLWFGEDYEHPQGAKTQRLPHAAIQIQNPKIGFFESLINASELDALTFGGDCAGKDPKAIKKKLSLNNTDYVICPSRDGCTLTACLQVSNESSKFIRSLAIVAVRVLVGSMPDMIPKEIIIMGSGRSIKLKKNVKRWYDFPLTDEETLLAVRNGFVTIWISPCHDSSSVPIIDSVEVYARARSELSYLSPNPDGGDKEESLSQSMKRSVQEQHSHLLICIQSLTFLAQITGRTKTDPLSAESKDTISHIIQQTALELPLAEGPLRAQTIQFLCEAEGDGEKRTFLIDEATLRGLMSLLQNLGKFLQTEFANVDIVSPKQEVTINRAIEVLVHILTSSITIARARGSNFSDVISALIAEKTCQVSMALEGKKILDLCQYFKAMLGATLKLFQPAQLVSELMLMEIACSADKPSTVGSNCIATFDTLAEYLIVDSTEIVKACCTAISTAIGSSYNKRNSSNPSPEQDLSTEVGVITYQCDSCLVFPITGQRYTFEPASLMARTTGPPAFLDIDLCKRCYDLGIAYSKTAPSSSDPLIINGQTLCVENENMTCGKILQMTSKPIAASSLEQAENAKKAGLALKTSQSVEVSSNKLGENIEVVKTESFRSQIFTHLLGLMTKTLDVNDKDQTSPPSIHVLQLILEIVLGSCTEELKAARGKEMALAFTQNMETLVKVCRSSDFNFSQYCSKLVVSLRTLAGLVLQNREISRETTLVVDGVDDAHHHNHKNKTDPRFVCEHGPAVRRRCSHGVHKDRRFYVCGLDRKNRCNYFKWSTDVQESSAQNENHMLGPNERMFTPVHTELQRIFSTTTLQEQFCSLVSHQFEKNQVVSSLPDVTHVNEGASSAAIDFPSIKTELDKLQDKGDGLGLALAKFGKSLHQSSSQLSSDSSSIEYGSKETFLCSSLDLLSLIVPTTGSPKWSDEWFSVLCEIISRNSGISSTVLRLARSMLLRLCGGRQEVYHRVRDHYVFGIQFRKLFQQAQDILDSALVVREQARQCGSDWRDEEVMFDTLPASGLLGVEDLISEDEYKTSTEESIGTVLDELLSAAVRVGNGTNTRSNSWRNFCGLPGFQAAKGTSAQNSWGNLDMMLDQIYHRPPIVSLMWLSSSLRGSNQVKALALLDIALSDEAPHERTVKFPADDIDGLLVGGYQTLNNYSSDPEQCLQKCFTVHDLMAFIKQFVMNGRSQQLRAISAKVARKLITMFSAPEKQHLFACLIMGPFQQVGALGNASKNFIDLLIMFVDSFGSELDMLRVSSCIASAFISQMTVLNEAFGTDMGSPSCNLSNCVHCQKQIPPKKATKSYLKKPEGSQATFLPDQVRSYQRGRLESSTAASVSSEFSSHNQLKFRVALSEVHVTVSDPRGRLVKSIGVYFSPRQVSDVSILKSPKYTHLWQRCGTLTLARGASEATCKLKHPVIAANLRFSYEEFHEKASNKRAADGSFVLYCPRCTRQVPAHGVCGNCGEVAFQCRKCRHINYDSLEAFLCVECGYCTAGSFSYELTAGIALNAIAILDEDCFQKSMAMLRVANKRQSELRNTLKKKLMVGIQQQKKNRGDQMENLDEMVLYGPHLKRALLGGMPKSEGIDDDDYSNKKSGSSRSKGSSTSLSERASSSSSRARNLLSLARSLRAEGGDGFGSRGDFLRQALLSAGGSGPSGLDSVEATDLISALSANIHARARDERGTQATTGAGGGGDGGKSDGSHKDGKTKLSPVEERDRLYLQMREAERECYELNRRIDAWNRLNNDSLTGTSAQNSFAIQAFRFLPSTCTVCSMQLTYQMLSLLYSVYATTNVAQFEHTVTSALIKILLTESQVPNPKLKDLNNLKRRAVITLASTSEVGSRIILGELKLRLTAVQDVTSAEILGKLIELDFPSVNNYIQLATDVLQGN